MSSAVLTQGIGSFGGVDCIPTLGFSCATRSTEVFTSVTTGNPRNNRITVFSGATFQYKDSGENQVALSAQAANELGEKFDDPRYYGRVL